MYDSSKILGASGLYTRIGLLEPTRTGYSGILDATAKATKSGRTYDYYHPLASFPNIYDSQDDSAISNANVNILIANLQKEAIETALSKVFEGQMDLIENHLLFKKENRFEDKITNSGKFVGFEITVPEDDSRTVVLNNAILQFDSARTFSLYLFHSSKKAALATFSVTTLANDFYTKSLAQYLYAQTSTYGPGKFYLGYFQNDLVTTQAYDRIWKESNLKSGFKCAGIKSISATPNGVNMFDLDSIEYRSECWGLNLDISSYADYTNLIMNNLSLFDNVQGYAFAIQVLELIKTSGRINTTMRLAQNLPDVANYDLSDQTEPRSMGLYTKLKIEVSRVRKSIFDDSQIQIRKT